MTDEQRRRKASRTRSTTRGRLGGSNKQSFDGVAVVTSRLGEERYEVFGAVDKSDMHQIEAHFVPEDEAKRILPNEALHSIAPARWQGDRLEGSLAFARLDERGFSSSSSEGVVVDGKLVWSESAADKKVQVTLARMPGG